MAFVKTKEKLDNAYTALKDAQGYTNKMQAPRLLKVTISSGVGKINDKAKIATIVDRLTRITGQKPAPTQAKQAIASFKSRKGQVIGYKVTLRGDRMKEFVDKVIHIALPRTRDFRGLPKTAIDDMGNYTIGIKEHTVFPETADEDLRDVFGLAITLTTTAKTKKEAEAFLRYLGLPLKA